MHDVGAHVAQEHPAGRAHMRVRPHSITRTPASGPGWALLGGVETLSRRGREHRSAILLVLASRDFIAVVGMPMIAM